MRRLGLTALSASLAAVAVLAGSASGSRSSDIYIFGKVLSRVPGKNLANVEVSWAYKCLGDKLGEATYEWTLELVRRQPKPEKTMVLGEGTSKTGSMTAQLSPGEYLLTANPFHCETERGAGYDKPEIGDTFVVPDFCAWRVSAVRGRVELEQAAAVRLAKPGDTARGGDAIVTSKRGTASLASQGNDGDVVVGGVSRLAVDGQCAREGGWRLRLDQGTVTARARLAGAGSRYAIATSNATATGRGATWRVDATGSGAKLRTKVTALSGKVTVAGKAGKAVALRAGLSTVVVGSAAPSTPARG